MKYFERELLGEVKKWMRRKEIIVIKGPRQSGKTTLLEMIKEWLDMTKGVNPENIIFLTFEDFENLEKFEENPKEFINSFILKENEKYYFLLDEIHYVKNCGQKLKMLYDLFKNIKFIATGSSSLELTSLTAKYLVGRIFSFELFPFSFYEFLLVKDKRMAKIYKEKQEIVKQFLLEGKNFKIKKDLFVNNILKFLNDYLTFGGYPEVIKAENKEEKKIILKNVYNTYVEKDIINFLKIHDTIKFKKLVTMLSSLTGKMLNYEDLTTACNSYYKEIIRWIDVLEQTYIIKTVRPFHKNLVTELRKNPKLYFVDNGLRNYPIGDFSSFFVRSDKGEIAENFVFNQLDCVFEETINFWRTTSKAEVDFVVDFISRQVPVEVKFKDFKKEKVSKSLHSFINTYSPDTVVVVTKNFWGEKRIGKTLVMFIPIVYL
ncbi:MAG: ATP-binding protein [Nanoarchaeota archaeon]|nr:ATP-binding protein [DPANN group archaeon]MBL7116269.1 ATP-binding protein [Nanoarchaeota archaeon]